MLAVAPAGEGVGHNSLGQLELTEWAFKEALRMIPPVPVIPRRALRDFEFGGYRIPAGTNVGVNTSHTHRMADYWPEPEKFDPMRFSPRSEEHTSELQSLMRISYAVFCLKQKKVDDVTKTHTI